MNGTTSVPKSVPRLVSDKVRLLSVPENMGIKQSNSVLVQTLNFFFFFFFFFFFNVGPPKEDFFCWTPSKSCISFKLHIQQFFQLRLLRDLMTNNVKCKGT